MEKLYSINGIKNRLPHRYPFLLVDGVSKLEPGKRIEGYKYTTINEPFYNGHFPEEPVFPGVLIIEALAQLGAILLNHQENEDIKEIDTKARVGYLAEVKNFRFKKAITPGNYIELVAEIEYQVGKVSLLKVYAKIEEIIVAKGTIAVTSNER